jgi:hypothetical protein
MMHRKNSPVTYIGKMAFGWHICTRSHVLQSQFHVKGFKNSILAEETGFG